MKFYFVLFLLLFFLMSNQVLSERIYYSTGSLKLACIESEDSDVSDYAEGICFGYIRANLETLFNQKLLCDSLLNRNDSLDDLTDLIISNLKFAKEKDVPIIFIHEILTSQFC